MKDSFGRTIDYLRLSITNLCNLSCIYCKPFSKKSHKEILRLEEIIEIIKKASLLGIRKIRITGGEPFMRRGISDFFEKIKNIAVEFFLTTNGVFLSPFLPLLKNAGISKINVALPSLNKESYKKITGSDEITKVIGGIKRARDSGFFIKINTVISSLNACEIMDFVKFGKQEGIVVRFIEFMPIGNVNWKEFYFSLNGIFNGKKEIERKGNGPARYYEIDGAKIGIISAMSKPFCLSCNRIRLTPDGMIRPCLGNNYEIDIKTTLRRGGDITSLIEMAIKNKPEGYKFEDINRQMAEIGG